MEISNCYARVKVSGHSIVGGLIGGCLHSPTVANCYSSEQVTGEENVGGLIGLDEGGSVVEGCFWDIDRSGQKTSDGGTGMTTAEMKGIGAYLGAGWDIDHSKSNLAGGYPFLSWQLEHSPVWLIPAAGVHVQRHHHPVKPNIPTVGRILSGMGSVKELPITLPSVPLSTVTVATDTLWIWAAGGAQMPNGDLLVAWERASTEPSNDGRIDAARSTDGGATWGASYALQDTENLRDVEPQFLVIGPTVFFFYSTLDEGGGPRTCHIYYKTSTDNGNTWSAATEIPKGSEVTVCTIQNPIIKTHSPNIGRIILPVQAVTGETWYGSCIYSDDNGAHWTRGGNMTASGKSLSEPTIVELSNGNLLAYLRNETDQVSQWKSTSTDGGATWSTAVDSGIQSPSAQSVLLRLANGHHILLWNNSTSSRIPLTVALSTDDCATWIKLKNIRTSGQWSNMGLFQLANGNIVAVYSDDAGATFRLHIYATIFTESNLDTTELGLDLQVGASSDDCFRRLTPSYFSLTELALLAGEYDASNYKYGSGLRFTNVRIPKGAIITTAYLTLRALSSQSASAVNSRISGEKADNPAAFSTLEDFDARWQNRSDARVDWDDIPPWTQDIDYQSPEIKTVIQEYADRPGRVSGDALVLFWEDFEDRSTHGISVNRSFPSYDFSPTDCAKLHIEYIIR